MQFRDRVALVTGAASKRGMGRAIALHLAKHGVNVAVADIDEAGVEEAAEAVRETGTGALGVQTDVSKEASVNAMAETVVKFFGRIDILVNNAGITQPRKLLDITETDWDRILSVNLKGAFLCSRAVSPTMINQAYGRIVSISSISAKQGGGVYGGAHYSASKAGILGLTKALARELLEYGITANSVSPGLVDTEIMAELSSDERQNMFQSLPMGRAATPLEIAEAVAFLASDDAGYITGVDINVNGGSYIS